MGTRGNDQSVLHLCALRGDWSDIQPGLLESGALEVQDWLGRTPLFLCVMLGDSQGAQLLLRAGARSDHGDHAGQTPLHLAARKGHRSLVRLLLAAGAPWARGDVHGCTPLHCVVAAAASWPAQLARSILGMLLDCMDVSQVDLQDKLKQTALHKSALVCHLENMLALLKKGANALMQDVDGRTALHLCTASSQLAALGCTFLLLDAEPSLISWQDYQGCTPLHLAVASGTLAVIDLLTQRSSGEVNALDDLFRTPLHWAAILAAALQAAAGRGNLEVLQWLLDHDGAPESSRQLSPLMAAARGGHTSCVIALLDFGAHGVDAGGRNALHWAVIGEQASTCDLLIQRGCRVDAADKQERTALHYAASRGSTDCTRVLLQSHANPNLTDAQGRTALHWAARCGSLAVAELLCANGALLSVPDLTHHRRTALDEASIRHEELCRWLRARGAVGAQEVRRAAAVAIQYWFRKWRKQRSLAVTAPDSSSPQRNGQESAHVDIRPNKGAAAFIIQSAWRRSAMRWRVTGAMAGTDEQAWGRALAHLQLLLTDVSPIPRWSPKEGNAPSFR
ncbi:uncharacterized protein [Dermacentor andersoni]|uniref:uncharacterized protein isoform X8 n=1 Tax=Dermacentor andersoni TaxID=34620 RepID=UPI0024171CFF|nr:inversin-like isoform X13 [Dermacentor andersoni]